MQGFRVLFSGTDDAIDIQADLICGGLIGNRTRPHLTFCFQSMKVLYSIYCHVKCRKLNCRYNNNPTHVNTPKDSHIASVATFFYKYCFSENQ